MKSTTILVAVIASLVGGAVGAFVMSQLAPVPEPAKVSTPVAAEVKSFDDTDLRGDTQRNSDAITDLQGELIRLEGRVEDLQEQRDSLVKENRELKKRAGESGDEVVSKPGEPKTGEVSPTDNPELETEVERAVAAALKKKEEKERAEWEAATRKETEGWMGDARDNISKKLDAELVLTQYQRDRINEIMADTTKRIADLMVSGDSKNEDGRSQWDTIWRETSDAIRNELGTAQQTSYDEIVGERGVVSIAWRGK